MLHICIQHLYFYEDINTVNKLYFYSPCSFLLILCASVFASLNKVKNTNPFKISETQKIIFSYKSKLVKINPRKLFPWKQVFFTGCIHCKFFPSAISHNRLKLILKFCRFGDSLIWEHRICEISDKLISEGRKIYHLGPYETIDEMLLKFRGQCSFRQYMPSKASRYNIKFWILADGQNHYCYNAIFRQGWGQSSH